MKRICTAILITIFASPAFAQATIFDNCKTLITDGLRIYNVKDASDANLNTVFDKYCDVTGSFKSQNAGIGLDAVIKQIPVKFTGTYGSVSQAMTNFCRDYQSVAASSSARHSYEETVAARAYDSFDMCIAMASQGVVARHKVESLERVNFFLAPGFGHPVKVRGVNTTRNVICKGQDPNAVTPGEIVFDGSSNVILANNATLGFACTRTGKTDDKGNTVLDEGVVTVFTDLSPNGNYTIFMPHDTRMAITEASAISAQLSALSDTEKELKKYSDNLKAEINAELSKLMSLPTDKPDGPYLGFDAQAGGDKPPFKYCPHGHLVTGLDSYLEDGHVKISLHCAAIPTLQVQ